jgi:hypothetical protein
MTHTYICNNIIYNNAVTGMTIGRGTNVANVEQYVSIYNNTLHHNRTGAIINGVNSIGSMLPAEYGNIYGGEIHLQNADNVSLRNNIIYAMDSKRHIAGISGFTVKKFNSDYNIFYSDNNVFIADISSTSFNGNSNPYYISSLSQFKSTYNQDNHSIVTHPLVKNAATHDYSISFSSPCKDAGDPATSTIIAGYKDFARNDRIFNNRIDIGAYEYILPADIPLINKINNVQFYPNPANNIITFDADLIVEKAIIKNTMGQNIDITYHSNGKIDVSKLAPGVYILELQSDKGRIIQEKFIKN